MSRQKLRTNRSLFCHVKAIVWTRLTLTTWGSHSESFYDIIHSGVNCVGNMDWDLAHIPGGWDPRLRSWFWGLVLFTRAAPLLQGWNQTVGGQSDCSPPPPPHHSTVPGTPCCVLLQILLWSSFRHRFGAKIKKTMQIYSEFTSCSIQTRSTQNKSSHLIFHFLFYGTHLCPQLWFDFSQIFPKMLASKALVHPDISCLTVSLLLLLFHFLILFPYFVEFCFPPRPQLGVSDFFPPHSHFVPFSVLCYIHSVRLRPREIVCSLL